MRTATPSTQFRGHVAKAMAQAHERAGDLKKDTTGTFPCPRCRSSLNFTVLMGGRCTWGRCTSGGCVAWQA